MTYLPTSVSPKSVHSEWRLFQQHQHPVAPTGFEDCSLKNPGPRGIYIQVSLFIHSPANNLKRPQVLGDVFRRASLLGSYHGGYDGIEKKKQREIYRHPE